LRGGFAPFWVAAVAGAALVSDNVSDAPIAWVLFTALASGPAWAAWTVGRRNGARRRSRARATATLSRNVASAAERAEATERLRLAAGLRERAGHEVAAMVAAADCDDAPNTLAHARSALATLRELLAELRVGPQAEDAPPPTVAGIRTLAARHRAGTRLSGAVRPLPVEVEVAVHRVVAATIVDEADVVVHFAPDGVAVTVRRKEPVSATCRRGLRALTDAAGGTLATVDDGIQVWLPEVGSG
jgi:hypothetical protein